MSDNSNKLVVLMLDGYRWDYFNRWNDKLNLRGFNTFINDGVQTEYLEPIFPVLSYPNWTTIGTGVYADKHGIIGNYMWDGTKEPEQNLFHLMKKETTTIPHWWEDSVEPIWTTAVKQGRRTFTRLWCRSDVPFDGVVPEEASGYAYAPGVQEIKDTLDIGVQKLIEGFEFVMLYGEHIDNVGHAHGPDSDEMAKAVKEVDDIFCRFLRKLEEANLQDVNIIVLSDHGMKSSGRYSGTKYINLDDYIDEEDVEISLDNGGYVSVNPAPGRLDIVYEKLKRMEGVTVYKKDEIPDEYHYKNGKFVLDIFIVAKPGYFIRGLQSREKQVPFREFNKVKPYCEGVHGYTPDLEDQRGIFFARGPAFKRGHTHTGIRMVDVHQIFVKVLDLKVAPDTTDGNWDKVAEMFEDEPNRRR